MSRVLLSIGLLQVLTIIVALVRAKVLAVLLGPASFGVVSTIDQLILTLAGLGALSLPFTALKFMARSHSQSHEAFERTASSFAQVLGILAIVTTLVATLALMTKPDIFGGELVPYRWTLHLALIGVPAVMLHTLFVNTVAAAQRAATAAGLVLLMAGVLAIAAAAGVIWRGLEGLYIATAIAGFTTICGTAVWLGKTFSLRLTSNVAQLVGELRANPEILSYSAYIYVAMGAYSLTLLLTRYVVFARLGEAAAGHLQAALSLALTVGAVLSPMSNLYLTPLLNREMAPEEKTGAANDFAGRMLGMLLLAALPVALFPKTLVSLLYTSEFAPAAGAVFMFIIWQGIYQVVNVYQQLLIGLDDVLFMGVAATMGFALAALLLPVTVPASGLGGAALALATGMLLYGILAIYRLWFHHHQRFSRVVLIRTVTVTMLVMVPGLMFRGGTELQPFGLVGRLCYAGGAVALLWLLLDRSERQWIIDLFLFPRRRVRRNPQEGS